MSPWLRRTAIALLATIAVISTAGDSAAIDASGSAPMDAAAAPNPCRRVATSREPRKITEGMLKAAFSVCRSVFPPASPPAGFDEHFGFLTLDQAAEELEKPASKPVPGPQRRYLTMLIAREDITAAKFDRMLRALDISPECRSALASAISTPPLASQSQSQHVSRVVYKMLFEPDDGGDFCRATVSCDHEQLQGGSGGRCEIHADVDTNHTVDQLRKAIDPHSWPQVMKAFFPDVYKIQPDSDCEFPTECSSGSCNKASNCNPSQDSSATIGSWDGKLYEHYEMNPGGLGVEIRNILEIDWDPASLPNGYNYALKQSISMKEAGLFQPTHKCGIAVDDGYVAIQGSASPYQFTSTKSLSFCATNNDLYYNAIAHLAMCAMSLAVEDNVCYLWP